jgi:hypothetical protein
LRYSVDDAGWGHVLLGCVIAVASEDFESLPFIGEIGVEYFQDPLFLRKAYLGRAYEIVRAGMDYYEVGRGDTVYCCSGYVLSHAAAQLREEGYSVVVESRSRAERRAHRFAEAAFMERLREVGVPVGRLLPEDSDRNRARNFYMLLNWAKADRSRERLLKTGWTFFHPERRGVSGWRNPADTAVRNTLIGKRGNS